MMGQELIAESINETLEIHDGQGLLDRRLDKAQGHDQKRDKVPHIFF